MAVRMVHVRALAAQYSAVEIKEKIKVLTDKLGEVDMITSANAGGTSYARQQRISIEDALELHQLALEWKESNGGLHQSSVVQIVEPVATL